MCDCIDCGGDGVAVSVEEWEELLELRAAERERNTDWKALYLQSVEDANRLKGQVALLEAENTRLALANRSLDIANGAPTGLRKPIHGPDYPRAVFRVQQHS